MLVRIPLTVLDTTLCDTVCQWLAAGRWFSPGTAVSCTNKTDCHYWNIVESGAKNHNSNPMSKDVQFITPTCVGLWLGYAISILLYVVYLCQILYKLFIHVFYCLESAWYVNGEGCRGSGPQNCPVRPRVTDRVWPLDGGLSSYNTEGLVVEYTEWGMCLGRATFSVYVKNLLSRFLKTKVDAFT